MGPSQPPSPLQVLMEITQVWPVCLKETPDSPEPLPLAFERHFVLNASLALMAGVSHQLLKLALGAILVPDLRAGSPLTCPHSPFWQLRKGTSSLSSSAA